MAGTASRTVNNIFLSISKIVFNEVSLFNIDFFNFEDQYTIGIGNSTETISHNSVVLDVGFIDIEYVSPNLALKKSVAQWFIICRMLAMVIELGVLIYIGIRMAMSTIASDQARYKKMIISWVESMIMLFSLQYIIQFLLFIGKICTDTCLYLRIWLEQDVMGFEEHIISMLTISLQELSGFSFAFYSILFCFLVYVQVKFFWVYLKRFLMVGFLIAISPLITVTYAIDKIGDEKAQAFSLWLKELIVNIFVQTLHAAIYLVFIFTAGEFAKRAPIIGLIFLMSIGRIEKMIKSVFGMRGMTSIKSVDDFGSKKGK